MKYTLIALALTLCSACLSVKDYDAENEQEILRYLNDNNLTAQKSSSGLYYIINNPGTGEFPTSNSNVTVAYRGYFTSGTVFEESDPAGISFSLQQVIDGWTEGIQYLKEGGSGTLLIPSKLAYGNSGRGNIPGGAVLIFDVELVSIN